MSKVKSELKAKLQERFDKVEFNRVCFETRKIYRCVCMIDIKKILDEVLPDELECQKCENCRQKDCRHKVLRPSDSKTCNFYISKGANHE